MSNNRVNLIIRPPKKGEETTRWDLATPENYEKIIWDSISSYNHRAQFDLAKLIYREYKKLAPKKTGSNPVIKNLALRLIQLFFESADQFALVYLCLLNKHNTPVFESYIESDNLKTRTFFKRCSEEELSDSEIKKIWGLDTIRKLKISGETKERIDEVIDEVLKIEKKNLKAFGRAYSDYDQKTGKTSYTSPVKGSFSVKHGFKMINPSVLTNKIWKFSKSNPTIMQEIVDIELDGTKQKKSVIRAGSMVRDGSKNLAVQINKLMKQMEFLSEEIKTISHIQKAIAEDPFYILVHLNKVKPLHLERNAPCPCGSGKKYKQCHYLKTTTLNSL